MTELAICSKTLTMNRFAELGPHLSGLIWAVMLVSAAIVITLPRESGIRTLVASTILRMIFSAGPEPTLWLLGTLTVRHIHLKPQSCHKVYVYVYLAKSQSYSWSPIG